MRILVNFCIGNQIPLSNTKITPTAGNHKIQIWNRLYQFDLNVNIWMVNQIWFESDWRKIIELQYDDSLPAQ